MFSIITMQVPGDFGADFLLFKQNGKNLLYTHGTEDGRVTDEKGNIVSLEDIRKEYRIGVDETLYVACCYAKKVSEINANVVPLIPTEFTMFAKCLDDDINNGYHYAQAIVDRNGVDDAIGVSLSLDLGITETKILHRKMDEEKSRKLLLSGYNIYSQEGEEE